MPDGIKRLHNVRGKFIELPKRSMLTTILVMIRERTLTVRHTALYRALVSGNEAQDALVDNARLIGGSRAIVSALEIFGRI